MRPHHTDPPRRPRPVPTSGRPDLAAMAMAGLLPADMFLEHLLDRIEGARP